MHDLTAVPPFDQRAPRVVGVRPAGDLLDDDVGVRVDDRRHEACRSRPDIRASVSYRTAKSFVSNPMARAAVSISFVVADVGSGTLSSRPISRASCRSFCIMVTSNQASSGWPRTKGPR